MKKLLFLTLFFAVFMISCEDDSNPLGSSGIELGVMTATVDGENFRTESASFSSAANQVIGNDLDISSQSTQSISLSFIGKEIEVESYDNITATYIETSIGSQGNVETWSTVTAEVDITTATESEIAGTFSFTGFNPEDDSEVNVSGEFRVER